MSAPQVYLDEGEGNARCEGLVLVLYLMGHVLLDPLFLIEFSLTNHVE